jgi:hypothetical protein
MDMRAFMVLMLLSAIVAGCATTAERSAQLEREVDQMIQYYGPACEKLGYQSNSDPWRDCILRLSAKDSLENYMMRYPNGFRYRGFPY